MDNSKKELYMSELKGMNFSAMKNSFQTVGSDLHLVRKHKLKKKGTMGEDRFYVSLARVQKFEIIHVGIDTFSNNENDIVIYTEAIDPFSKPRVKLDTKTTKQLYETLLNMHGFRANITVLKCVDNKGKRYFFTHIKDLSFLPYNELRLPATMVIDNSIENLHPKNKFNSLRDTISHRPVVEM